MREELENIRVTAYRILNHIYFGSFDQCCILK